MWSHALQLLSVCADACPSAFYGVLGVHRTSLEYTVRVQQAVAVKAEHETTNRLARAAFSSFADTTMPTPLRAAAVTGAITA
jgi:hypothetical protein